MTLEGETRWTFCTHWGCMSLKMIYGVDVQVHRKVLQSQIFKPSSQSQILSNYSSKMKTLITWSCLCNVVIEKKKSGSVNIRLIATGLNEAQNNVKYQIWQHCAVNRRPNLNGGKTALCCIFYFWSFSILRIIKHSALAPLLTLLCAEKPQEEVEEEIRSWLQSGKGVQHAELVWGENSFCTSLTIVYCWCVGCCNSNVIFCFS